MTMKIDLEATARIRIEFNEDMILEVMRNHNGDFKDWAKSNYSDYMEFNDFDIDYDDCDYDEEEAKKFILKSKDILGLDNDFNIDRVIAHRTMLRSFASDTPTIDDEIEEFKIDIDLVEKAINYTDFKNPKFELNYIHLDKDTISATDTMKLIHISKHKYSNFDNDLFPPCFIEPLQNGAKLYKNNQGHFCINFKGNWFTSDLSENWNGIKFPDVERIFLPESGYKNKIKMSLQKFTSNSITQKYQSSSFPKELITFKIDNKDKFIKEIYYNEVLKLFDDLKDVYLSSDTPVHFIGKDMQVVVMPVILD